MGLKLIWNDILKERAEALVTPASRNAQVGIGLDRIIHKAAGDSLAAARRKLGRIAPGNVGVTKPYLLAGKTGAKWVIHALGPAWEKTSGAKEELILDGCYLRILLKAAELGCKSIAIPVLSSGKFGMPMDRAVDVAVKAINDFLAAFPAMEVKLVGIDEDFYSYASKRYKPLAVARITAAKAARYRKKVGRREDDPDSTEDRFEIGAENDVFGELLLDRLAGDGTFRTMFQNIWHMTKRNEAARRRERKKAKLFSGDDLFIVNKGALASASGISESTIKHFCTGEDKAMRTSKENLIALSAAMKLPLPYAERFLATCGYRLGSSKRDRVVREFFRKGNGDLAALNTALSMAECAQIHAEKAIEP